MFRLLTGLLVLLPLLYSSPLHAEGPPDEGPAVIVFNQGQISVLRDPTLQVTLEQARTAQAEGKFQQIPGNLSLGFTPDATWLHLSVAQTAQRPTAGWLEVMPPFLDDIRLFHIRPDGQIDERRGGDRLPQSAKEHDYRGTLFKLDLQPGQHDIYLRLQTTSTTAAIVKLWQPAAFEGHLRTSYFAYGLYFSLIFTVLLFNCVNWLVARLTIFLVYSGYLFLNALQWLSINGFVSEFIFPERPLLANLTLGMTLSLAAAMAYGFFIMVLELKAYHPLLYRFSLVGMVLSIITAVATPLGYYGVFAPWLLGFAIFSLCAVPWPAYRLLCSGDLWARLLATAYICYSLLLAINILGSLAVLPFSEASNFVGMISNIFHVTLLHFAVLLHYRRIETEHVAALEKSALAERQMALEKTHRDEQSQLLAMITHEIRTPIAVIDAANESLRMLDGSPLNTEEDRQRRYERIHNAVMRMNLVMDMVLAQKENESLPFEPKAIDLTWLTHDVIELIGADAIQRVRFDVPEVDIAVQADPRLLRIALLNLLGNALKYSPASSPVRIRLETTASSAGDGPGATWVIEDRGSGIPVGMEQKIFEKFQRGDERSNQAGMGLGLFLVASIAARHRGRVAVKNQPTGGACFSLWLPLGAAQTFQSKVS